jgi:ABC-type Fe3+-citrate transport system substrate-binding protein
MKKIIFVFLAILLLLVAGCSKESSQETLDASADESGYLNDIDEEFDSSETDSLDKDMDLNWI